MIPDSRQLTRSEWKELYETNIYEPKLTVNRSMLHDEIVTITWGICPVVASHDFAAASWPIS